MRQKLAYFIAAGYTCLREDDASRVSGGLHLPVRRNDMSEKQKRILFLCAHRSVRELIAASLLAAHKQKVWDIWIAPAPFLSDELALSSVSHASFFALCAHSTYLQYCYHYHQQWVRQYQYLSPYLCIWRDWATRCCAHRLFPDGGSLVSRGLRPHTASWDSPNLRAIWGSTCFLCV